MRRKLIIGTLLVGGLSLWLLVPDAEPDRGPARAAAAREAMASARSHAETPPRRRAPGEQAGAHAEHAAAGESERAPEAVPEDGIDTNPDPHQAAYRRQLDEVDAKLDEDPVAQRIPMLFDTPPEKQLETLRWMKELPRDKLLSAIPALSSDRSLSIAARREQAAHVVDDLIRGLEEKSARTSSPN